MCGRRGRPAAKGPTGANRLVPETNGRKRRQIYRENEVFLKKKCAGVHAVWEFICMFAVLKFY